MRNINRNFSFSIMKTLICKQYFIDLAKTFVGKNLKALDSWVKASFTYIEISLELSWSNLLRSIRSEMLKFEVLKVTLKVERIAIYISFSLWFKSLSYIFITLLKENLLSLVFKNILFFLFKDSLRKESLEESYRILRRERCC